MPHSLEIRITKKGTIKDLSPVAVNSSTLKADHNSHGQPHGYIVFVETTRTAGRRVSVP